MENRKQTLTIHQVEPEAAEASLVNALRFNTSSPNVGPKDICQGSECFEVRQEGRVVGHYVLRRVRRSNGQLDGIIMAVSGMCKSVDLCTTLLPCIKKQLADCDWIEFSTKRRGLAAKMTQQGFGFCGYKFGMKIK